MGGLAVVALVRSKGGMPPPPCPSWLEIVKFGTRDAAKTFAIMNVIRNGRRGKRRSMIGRPFLPIGESLW